MTYPNPLLSRRRMLAASAAVVVSFAAASCTAGPTPSPTPAGRTPTPSDPWRPVAHLTAEKNWLNDPNGLVYHDGTYHAFYQYNPRANSWGNMSWGHSTSTDLVHWEQQPVAMEASGEEEIFSGCMVMDTKNASGLGSAENPPMVALYTSAYGKNGALPKAPRPSPSPTALTAAPNGRNTRAIQSSTSRLPTTTSGTPRSSGTSRASTG